MRFLNWYGFSPSLIVRGLLQCAQVRVSWFLSRAVVMHARLQCLRAAYLVLPSSGRGGNGFPQPSQVLSFWRVMTWL